MVKPSRIRVLIVCLLFSMAGTFAQTGETRPVARLAAAISMAEAGIADGNATLIVTAQEVMAHYAPQGQQAMALQQTYGDEAQFLLRGDAVLTARLQASRASKPSVSGRYQIYKMTRRLNLPDGVGLYALAVSNGGVVRSIDSATIGGCKQRASVWVCDEAMPRGVISLDYGGTDDAWIVIETRPLNQ